MTLRCKPLSRSCCSIMLPSLYARVNRRNRQSAHAGTEGLLQRRLADSPVKQLLLGGKPCIVQYAAALAPLCCITCAIGMLLSSAFISGGSQCCCNSIPGVVARAGRQAAVAACSSCARANVAAMGG
jgi:hypothetical protein